MNPVVRAACGAALAAWAALAGPGAAVPASSEPPPDRTPVLRLSLPASSPPEPVLPYAVLELTPPPGWTLAEVWIPGVPGELRRYGEAFRYLPEHALIPGLVHPLAVRVRAGGKEFLYVLPLQVSDMGGGMWVDVDLSVPQRVRVYQGRRLVRSMVASAGAPGSETPLGLYYLQDRGLRFYSYRYRQGALYWVRFYGNYLFHSVPVDQQGGVLEEELARLGLPASHGCIPLYPEDAEWFYRNVPEGTPVLIHR